MTFKLLTQDLPYSDPKHYHLWNSRSICHKFIGVEANCIIKWGNHERLDSLTAK